MPGSYTPFSVPLEHVYNDKHERFRATNIKACLSCNLSCMYAMPQASVVLRAMCYAFHFCHVRDLCLTATTNATSCYILLLLGMLDRPYNKASQNTCVLLIYSSTKLRDSFSSHQELPSSFDLRPRTKQQPFGAPTICTFRVL